MASKEYPVILRFEGMDPSDIGGYEAHRYCRGGDLGHIDCNKPAPRRLIGSTIWAQEALAKIALMKIETFAAELEDLDRRNRRKDLAKRRIEGPRDPWRASLHRPMRELILTANKKWFEQTDSSDVQFTTSQEDRFEARVTCHGVFPPFGIRVRPNEGTDNEAIKIQRRTDYWHPNGA